MLLNKGIISGDVERLDREISISTDPSGQVFHIHTKDENGEPIVHEMDQFSFKVLIDRKN